MKNKPTLILGASNNPERYSYKAQKLLKLYHHPTFPMNPTLTNLQGDPVVNDLSSFQESIDTVTVYVRPAVLETLVDDVIALKPNRVIFNPGTESPALERKIADAGIEVNEACTLVLLSTGQF
jgi:uncharacterized protein